MVAIISNVLLAMSVHFNFDAFTNPVMIFSMEYIDTGLLKWGLIADMFGFYLLLLPAVFYLYIWMKEQSNWGHLATFCGSAYVLTGATGAAILAAAWPAILNQYALSEIRDQPALRSDFSLVTNIVYAGMWNMLEVLLAGIWWLVIGRLLLRQYKFFGGITILLGIVALVNGVANITGMVSLSAVSLNIYLGLAPAWAIWLGLTLILYKVKLAA
ncbi:MAG TPA: hypothetical protein VGD17_14760 [Chitinophagaceae bacterium]